MKNRRDLPVFLAVACIAAWLTSLPVWLSGEGLRTPLLTPVGAAMMYTPTLGVLAVWLMKRAPKRQWARDTGLGLGERRGRTALLVLAAWFGTPIVVFVTLLVSQSLGLYSMDLAHFSGFRELSPGLPEGETALIVLQLAVTVAFAPLLSSLLAFGEEWGWRGWLLPRLTTFGIWPALLMSGVIWGIWHAPLTLLGYNYPQLGPWAALMFVPFCAIYGLIIGWMRLHSGSVWPAVIAHGSFNTAGGLPFLLGKAGAQPDFVLGGIIGLVGWGVLLVLGAVLLLRWPVRIFDSKGTFLSPVTEKFPSSQG